MRQNYSWKVDIGKFSKLHFSVVSIVGWYPKIFWLKPVLDVVDRFHIYIKAYTDIAHNEFR